MRHWRHLTGQDVPGTSSSQDVSEATQAAKAAAVAADAALQRAQELPPSQEWSPLPEMTSPASPCTEQEASPCTAASGSREVPAPPPTSPATWPGENAEEDLVIRHLLELPESTIQACLADRDLLGDQIVRATIEATRDVIDHQTQTALTWGDDADEADANENVFMVNGDGPAVEQQQPEQPAQPVQQESERGNALLGAPPGELRGNAHRSGISAADVAARMRQLAGLPLPHDQDEDDFPTAAELAEGRRRMASAQAEHNTLPVHVADHNGWAPPYTWDPMQPTHGYLPAIYTHPMFTNRPRSAAAPLDPPPSHVNCIPPRHISPWSTR